MKNKLLKVLIVYLCCTNFCLAAQTPSEYFVATMPVQREVVVDSSGTTNSTITPSTGALVSALIPSFYIKTNSRNAQYLTFSATTNTQSGAENAIFNIASNKYIILSNVTYQPTSAALANIKSGSPTPCDNQNAIAYTINDPPSISGALSVTYNTTNKNWDLVLTNRGQTPTSVTIPSGSALSGTYSSGDRAGTYQATVMLTFN